MSEDWRDWWRSRSQPGNFAHPASSASGDGTGSFSSPQPGSYPASARVPDPDSAAGHNLSWHDIARFDIEERGSAVYEAYRIALHEAPRAIFAATGYELYEMLRGIIPGVLGSLMVVAIPAAGLGLAFGLLAAPAGPEVAIPLAGVGAEAGFALGAWILEQLGLAFLVGYISSSLVEAGTVATTATKQAWNSVDHPRLKRELIRRAGWQLAFALGIFWRGALQGMAAFLMAKGPDAAASRVPELVERLRVSKLGALLAAWVEQEPNWRSLINNELPKADAIPEGRGVGGVADPAKTIVAPESSATMRPRDTDVAAEGTEPGEAAETTKTQPRARRNGHLAGLQHPKTGVPFDESGFPVFDSMHDVKLPPEKIGPNVSDEAQFKYATEHLKAHLDANPEERQNFTQKQLDEIDNGEPRIDDYTWHHSEDGQTLELVDRDIHAKTGHDGGRKATGGR
jgi:hypothetical protein